MTRPGRPAGGFTLIELLVALIVALMMLLGFWAISANAYHWYRWSFHQGVVQAGTLLGYQRITRDLAVTTSITSPAAPCPNGPSSCTGPVPSDTLTGCTNYDVLSDAIISSASQMKAYSYCVKNPGGELWYASTTSASPISCCHPPSVCTPVVCGTAAPLAAVVRVASGVTKDQSPSPANPCGTSYFCRPANVNNVVEQHYWISMSGSTTTVRINTADTTAMSAFSP